MSSPTTYSKKSLSKGAQVYTKSTLSFYDILVHQFSNRFLWKCETKKIMALYNEHISENHCDIGVGTGYFLDKCQAITQNAKITLVDQNQTCLEATARRIARYKPKTIAADVLKPLNDIKETFDSVAITYLIHCLTAPLSEKRRVFEHLSSLMKPGATLFGATILNRPKNFMAKKLMAFYNKKGVFTNTEDTLSFLQQALESTFTEVSIEVDGSVALFTAIKK